METLEAVKPYYDEAVKNGDPVGLACAMKNAGVGVGIPDTGRTRLTVRDGKLHIFAGASCIGQGLGTVLTQTVCGETGETGETGEVIPAAGHSYKDGKCTVCGAADPNANSGGNTGNNGTDSPNTADGAAMGLWLSLMTVAVLAGAVLVAGKTPRA